MIESGGCLCLLTESEVRVGVANEFRRQELQRDCAVKTCVNGLVDDAHPAVAQLLDDAIVRQRLTIHDSSVSKLDG